MKIPILADFGKSVATDYGVLLPDGVPLRALFIIDPKGLLRYHFSLLLYSMDWIDNFINRQITVNDLPVGRNVDEVITILIIITMRIIIVMIITVVRKYQI